MVFARIGKRPGDLGNEFDEFLDRKRTPISSQLLTKSEAAAYCRVSVRTF
jgi:hypothetical protein